MVRSLKRLGAVFLCIALCLLMSIQAYAVSGTETDEAIGLTLTCKDEETPLTGMAFEVYLVANVQSDGGLALTEPFDSYPVELPAPEAGETQWRALATTLEGYVLRDRPTPAASGSTNQKGEVTFPPKEQAFQKGLYLIVGSRHKQNGKIYDPSPSLILLPWFDKAQGKWVWQGLLNPKFTQTADPDMVTRKVLKIWNDAGLQNSRPEQITVQLLCDDRVYDTVVLDRNNNWQHTWTNLDGKYQWRVVEKETAGYIVSVSQEGSAFVITNTAPDTAKPPPEPPGKLPQTGQLWWPVPWLVTGGLFLLAAGLVQRRREQNEKT